jgi:hypothetical protein
MHAKTSKCNYKVMLLSNSASGYIFPVIKWFDYKVHLGVIGINLMTKIMASTNFTDWFCKNTVQSGPYGTIVTNASFVKNLGIFFDRTLCMQK